MNNALNKNPHFVNLHQIIFKNMQKYYCWLVWTRQILGIFKLDTSMPSAMCLTSYGVFNENTVPKLRWLIFVLNDT